MATTQELRGTIETHWNGYSAQQRDELATFDALVAKAARTDVLEADIKVALAERDADRAAVVTLQNALRAHEAENAAFLRKIEAAKSLISSAPRTPMWHLVDLVDEVAVLVKERNEAHVEIKRLTVKLAAITWSRESCTCGDALLLQCVHRVGYPCYMADGAQAQDKAAVPDECAASGESCSYASQGRNGEMQCRYCGKPQAHDKAARESISKEWCMNMARLEGDTDFTVGTSGSPQQASEQRAAVDVSDDTIKQLFRASCDVVVKGRNLMTDSAAPSFVRSLPLLKLSSRPSQGAALTDVPVELTRDEIAKRWKAWPISDDEPLNDVVDFVVALLASHPVTKAVNDGMDVETESTLVSLKDAPTGLFWFGDTLGFKSEYEGDVFVISSGEVFWGGTDNSHDRNALMVAPFNIKRIARCDGVKE